MLIVSSVGDQVIPSQGSHPDTNLLVEEEGEQFLNPFCHDFMYADSSFG